MKKFLWLEVMRGGAAVWVLLHHAVLTTNSFFEEVDFPFFARGLLGVDFFFVLSGFIIAFASSRMLARGKTLGEYFSHRIVRIYVPYLPVGVALYFAYQLLPDLSAADREIGLLTSFTLLPTAEATALSVAWTLKHELLFYLLFASIFISRAFFIGVMGAWLVGIVFLRQWLEVPDSGFLQVLLNPLNLWFYVGIAVFLCPQFRLSRNAYWAGFLMLATALYVLVINGFSRIYIGLVFATMIILFTKVENLEVPAPRFLLYLGAASYSVYLVHNPAQSVIARILPIISESWSPVLAFWVISGASLVAGIIYFAFYEKHVVAWCKSKTNEYFRTKAKSFGVEPARD
ncbi:acyltransferase family protein [Marinobacter salsuginis]|jgi:exopolysaccharide production protein ExoZ|uniref:acyltransferase family protein n=1 Tax=Marinobacter salsuginis TaxID=418719 RepID=UPI00273D4C7B|nr:acyltransferase [Marinobacter salsuginis]